MQRGSSFVAIAPVLFLTLVFALPGQRQLQEFTTRTRPYSAPQTTGSGQAVSIADFNGDGALDVVVGKLSERNRLYVNDTTGYFFDVTTSSLPDDTDFTESVAVADVDGDGDQDLFFGNSRLLGGSGGDNRLYLNDGSGQFTDVTAARMPPGYQRTTSMATGDVDGDGDVDLVCGHSTFLGLGAPAQQNRLYLNDGSGFFTDASSQLPVDSDDTQSVALGDVDGDGDLDLVCGNSGLSGVGTDAQNRLYVNDGTGLFTDATAQLPVDSDDTLSVALGDVDGDGDLDLVCGNGDPSGAAASLQNRLYVNNGTGGFSDATAMQLPVDADDTQAVALADVDGDSDLDIVLGNSDALAFGHPKRDRLYLNDGTGSFTDATGQLASSNDDTRDVGLGDVDGDGALDIVTAVFVAEHRLAINDGSGSFGNQAAPPTVTERPLPTTSFATRAIALGDVDGDGDPDALVANHGANVLIENDATGWFTDVTASRLPTDSAQSQAVVLVDVDGDGDLDAVTGNQGQNFLYVNDGTGMFTDVTGAQMPVDTEQTNSIAVGDVDGDGDMDLLLGNGILPPSGAVEQSRLYLNDGAGTFTDVTASQLPVGMHQTRAVLLIDVDADGDLDALLANRTQNRIYLNDGAGTFADVTGTHFVPQLADASVCLAAGDVDGDGDPDLVVGNGYGRGAVNRLYFNDGAGVFTAASSGELVPFSQGRTHALALGDLDEDGDLDIFEGDARTVTGFPLTSSGQDRVLLNDGTGVFTDATSARLSGGRTHTRSVTIGDIDMDGDLDVLVGTRSNDRLVGWANTHRHLHQPFFPTLAHSYELQYYAKPGYAANDHTGAAVLSFALAPSPVPIPGLGTFYLDPTALVALPSTTIPQGSGVTTQPIPIPAEPALIGLAVFAQAVVVDDMDPSDAHLTGHTAETVRSR